MFDYKNTPHYRLEQAVWQSDRDVNEDWAKEELYAIAFLALSEEFLEKTETHSYSNAGQSTVLYAIGGTDEAPTEYPKGLNIQTGRISPPDIDIDIDDRKREKIIERTREVYGEEKVAHIGTFGSVGARSAIRDAARVLGFPYQKGDDVANLVPDPVLGVTKTIDEAIESPDFRRAIENDVDVKDIVAAAKGLEGILRQTGIHAAGVVVAKSDITDFIPVMQRPIRPGENGPTVTQWDMHRVEEHGQLKIDYLGLRNLGILDMTVDYIKENRGETVEWEDVPLDDELTFQQLREGKSVGCFQIEGGGMRNLMLSMQPTTIEDIFALISLYRPGPLGSGMHETFINRKHGREKVESYHPVLDNVLDKTYGVMLYQEDILAVARELAGFNASEADQLRKAIGKKLMDKIGLYREKFVQGCKDTHNVKPEVANKIYSDIEYFGGYGFNRAHAASYGMVSYLTAYYKFHYPAEYMAALLSSVDNKADAAPYLHECREMGIKVLPPSINESEKYYKIRSDDEILIGFSSIAGIGDSVVRSILSGRQGSQYDNLYHFMRDCDPALLNKAILEHLVHSGALDDLVEDRDKRTLTRAEKSQVLDLERQELGLFLTEHPLTGVWHTIEPQITCTIDQLEQYPHKTKLKLGGILSKVVKKTTKRNQTMYILGIEDVTGVIEEVLVFPNAVKDNTFEVGEIAIIEGTLIHEGDDEHTMYKIFFNNIERPEIPEYGTGKPVIIHCNTKPTYDNINTMKEIIDSNPGDSVVYLQFQEGEMTMHLQFKKPTTSDMQNELQKVIQ